MSVAVATMAPPTRPGGVAMTSIEEAPCPQCGGTLVLHCANKACMWLKCLTEKCAAVVDAANRRGFARNENRDLGWVPVTFEESK